MTDDMQNIKRRTVKLFKEIYQLKHQLQEQSNQYEEEMRSFFMSIINQLDEIEINRRNELVNAKGATSEQVEMINAFYQRIKDPLLSVLSQNNVIPLRPTMMTDPEFTQTIHTITNPELEDGQIVEVLRPGYLRGEELIRPTEIVAVQNA